jgi:hypothetical protein
MLSKKTLQIALELVGDISIPVKHEKFDDLVRDLSTAKKELTEALKELED